MKVAFYPYTLKVKRGGEVKRIFFKWIILCLASGIFSGSYGNQSLFASDNAGTDTGSEKERSVKKFANLAGYASGSLVGVAHIYFISSHVTGYHGPQWKNYLTVAPSLVIGPMVGKYAVKWMTDRMLKRRLKPLHAVVPGALYGALCGTVICSTCVAPILICGYLLDTIHFNRIKENYVIPQLIGMSILGGAVYGGTVGAIAGSFYAPAISVYMKF